MIPHGHAPVRRVVDASVTHTDDNVAGLESGRFRKTALLHRAHQHTLAILHSEKVAELRSQVLHDESRPRWVVHDDAGEIHLRHCGYRRNGGYWRNWRYRMLHDSPAVCQRSLQRDGLAVPADTHTYFAPRRDLMNHAPELFDALHPLPIQ